jgi:hypothetical protein|tara:strand:+ start:37942 stop:38193 length:252 start_codon:yes stop_codon:yes gene_type:complete
MKKTKRVDEPKLFEYRIKYNAGAGHAELDNYHYYNAPDAQSALDFHNAMIKKHNLTMQTISVEKYNPYSRQWEDESAVLNQSA